MTKKRFLQRHTIRTVEEVCQCVVSDRSDDDLIEDAADNLEETEMLADDVDNAASEINDGAMAVESIMMVARFAKRSLKDDGKGLSMQTVESINMSAVHQGAVLGCNGPMYKLNPADFASEAKALVATRKVADRTIESLTDAINDVVASTAAATALVADSVGSLMTHLAEAVTTQATTLNDVKARVAALVTAGRMKGNATSTNASLAYVTNALHHNDAIAILHTRNAVVADIVDNINPLPEHTLEHLLDDADVNPFAAALELVYHPLMDSFDKVSQDTVPFVESGLDPDTWTPYMSKAFGMDGNAAILSVSIPFMHLAMGETVYDDAMSFSGTWFMECDVTEGSATDAPTDTANPVLDVVEMQQLLDAVAPMDLQVMDKAVEAAASMAIYLEELKKIFADADHAVIDDARVMVGLGMIVDFSEYLSMSMKIMAHCVGDTDRVIEACVASIQAINALASIPAEPPAAA